MLKAVQINFSWGNAFTNSLLGWFFNLVTPMAAGGQPFQIYHLTQRGVPSKTAANVIFSRFVVNALLLVGFIGLGTPKLARIGRLFPGGYWIFGIGLGTTVGFALLFFLILMNPLQVGFWVFKSRHTKLGKFIGKISKQPRWSLSLLKWTHTLQREITFLWTARKSAVMVDILLNFGLIVAQGFSLYLVFAYVVPGMLSFWQVMVVYVVVWQVVFYIPTPGASGSLEGLFTLVFAGLTGRPEASLLAIITWRLGSYYLFLLFGLGGFLVYTRRHESEKIDQFAR